VRNEGVRGLLVLGRTYRHEGLKGLRMLNIPHRLRLRQKTMLCCARQMQSSAYSPRARRPLDLRPQQRCVAGAEGPPIKRHESAYVEREEDVVLPSDECSRPRGASPLKTRESCIPVHLTQGPGRTGRTPGATMTPHTALHIYSAQRQAHSAQDLHSAPSASPLQSALRPCHNAQQAHTPSVHAWDTHTMSPVHVHVHVHVASTPSGLARPGAI
jgi:hypothetical protein